MPCPPLARPRPHPREAPGCFPPSVNHATCRLGILAPRFHWPSLRRIRRLAVPQSGAPECIACPPSEVSEVVVVYFTTAPSRLWEKCLIRRDRPLISPRGCTARAPYQGTSLASTSPMMTVRHSSSLCGLCEIGVRLLSVSLFGTRS